MEEINIISYGLTSSVLKFKFCMSEIAALCVP